VNHENISHCNRQQAQYWARQQCGWAEDSLIVAFFGFLHPVKGLETLLTAFQSIVVTHPQARLLLIGGVESLALPGEQATQYWNQLCTQIAQSNLKSVVYMTGFLEAKVVSTYLTAADIGVLPFNHGVTLKSGSLLTLLCHHLPVIVTDATPPDPQLSSTFLKRIPTRQSKPLMAALTELLENPNLRQQLATAGFAFSQQFSWSRIIDAHLAIYQSVGFSS
jgi:glycosyltransferase involved in cell wall biosynthesis